MWPAEGPGAGGGRDVLLHLVEKTQLARRQKAEEGRPRLAEQLQHNEEEEEEQAC